MEEEKIIAQRSIVEEGGWALGKYLDRIVGSKNILYLLKYEFCNMLSNCPGASGLFLRHIFYPGLFGSVGKGVQFGRGMTIRGGLRVNIGSGTLLDDFVVLDCKSEYNPGIVIDERCLISRNTKISTGYTGYVKIGEHSIIGENCIIHGPGGIEIGRDVLVSDSVLINAGSHVYTDFNRTILSQGITAKGIKIGDDTWISSGAIVTDGVAIGKGCVIEAGSVVNFSIPDYSVVAGVPAKVVGSRRSAP